MKHLLLLPTLPPPPSGRDDSPPQGDLQHYVAVIHLYTWVKRDGEAKLPLYSNDTAMNFIPEQVHLISTYFSVFVYFNDILFLYKSFQNSFILVFNPSEILFLVLNFILEA